MLPTPTFGGHGLGFIVSQLAEGLLARGHDVTLFAKPDSTFSGTLVTPADCEGYVGEVALAREALALHRQYPFDAILDNSHIHALADMLPDIPVVNVFHDNFQEYRRCAVLLSTGQRALMPPVFETARIIPNAIDRQSFEVCLIPREYVLFMGALAEIKQPLLAIEACARLNVRLVMAGAKINGGLQFSGYENVHYTGVIAGGFRSQMLREARVFLQLGTVESFGLTTLEANLCGTPVVAWPAGGSLDLIKYGVNGVFVSMSSDRAGAVASAIERAWNMNRSDVRQYAEKFTDVDGQLDAYEDALHAVICGKWW